MTARTAARNLSAISLHKFAQFLGAFLFAAVVPRALGPELFGQIAFVLSLSLLLQMAGDLGGLDMLGRLVPGWSEEGQPGQHKIGWLAWQLTWARLAIGVLATAALAVAAPLAGALALAGAGGADRPGRGRPHPLLDALSPQLWPQSHGAVGGGSLLATVGAHPLPAGPPCPGA